MGCWKQCRWISTSIGWAWRSWSATAGAGEFCTAHQPVRKGLAQRRSPRLAGAAGRSDRAVFDARLHPRSGGDRLGADAAVGSPARWRDRPGFQHGGGLGAAYHRRRDLSDADSAWPRWCWCWASAPGGATWDGCSRPAGHLRRLCRRRAHPQPDHAAPLGKPRLGAPRPRDPGAHAHPGAETDSEADPEASAAAVSDGNGQRSASPGLDGAATPRANNPHSSRPRATAMNDHPPRAHGLRHDLEHLARLQAPDRRRALRLFGGLAAGSLPLLGLVMRRRQRGRRHPGSSSGSLLVLPSSSSASTSSGSAAW